MKLDNFFEDLIDVIRTDRYEVDYDSFLYKYDIKSEVDMSKWIDNLNRNFISDDYASVTDELNSLCINNGYRNLSDFINNLFSTN